MIRSARGSLRISPRLSTSSSLNPAATSPGIVPYADRGQRTFVGQALAVRAATAAMCSRPGYALVMVHRTVERQNRDEDQLAAMVVRELRQQHDIRATVIHSDVPRHAYREERAKDGRIVYGPVPALRRKLAGYLRNVVIAKLLLTNQRWPFVLATPLHADVTVGVDVKNNSAGLLVLGAHGSNVRSGRSHFPAEGAACSKLRCQRTLWRYCAEKQRFVGAPLSRLVVHPRRAGVALGTGWCSPRNRPTSLRGPASPAMPATRLSKSQNRHLYRSVCTTWGRIAVEGCS